MGTPITGFYAGLLAIIYVYLSLIVIHNRRKLKIGLGDGENRHFQQIIRSHGNFAEYVPITLVLMLVAEINSSNLLAIHLSGIAILFGRLMHAYGLRHHYGASWQRIWGGLLTFASIITLAVLNLYVLYH